MEKMSTQPPTVGHSITPFLGGVCFSTVKPWMAWRVGDGLHVAGEVESEGVTREGINALYELSQQASTLSLILSTPCTTANHLLLLLHPHRPNPTPPHPRTPAIARCTQLLN